MRSDGIFLSHMRSERVERHFHRLVTETNDLIEWRFVFNPKNGAEPQVDLQPTPARTAMAKRYREFLRNGGVQNGLMDVVIFPLVLATGADFVWAMEYDVDFSGPWSQFFEPFRENAADLLSSTILPYENCQDWWHWQTAEPPTEVTRSVWHRAFHPVMRISRRFAAWYQEQMTLTQWRGHYEYTIPTSAIWGGFRVEDLGGQGPLCPPDRKGHNYSNTPSSSTLAPGTLVWRPSRTSYFHETPNAFSQPDTLYHPVKAGVSEWVTTPTPLLVRWKSRIFGRGGSR
jgi:hypothetical protein